MRLRGRNQDRQRRAIFFKNTTNAQYKKALKDFKLPKKGLSKLERKGIRKLLPFADADRDGVQNIKDCMPFDRKRHAAQVYLEPSEKDAPLGMREGAEG